MNNSQFTVILMSLHYKAASSGSWQFSSVGLESYSLVILPHSGSSINSPTCRHTSFQRLWINSLKMENSKHGKQGQVLKLRAYRRSRGLLPLLFEAKSRQSGYSTPFRFKSSQASAPTLHPSASHHSIHTPEQHAVKIIICVAGGKEYYHHYSNSS